MDNILDRAGRFRGEIFARESALYEGLARHGQEPKALMISCADSRVVPEHITQAGPGELFVCRNAGNIVPPFAQANGGVSSTVEYAVVVLKVRDIVVCGHSDCGAMKAFLKPDALAAVPNVAAWLRHAHAAECAVNAAYPHLDDKDKVQALAMENVITQIQHLRTHPSVAAAMARGELTLHGWFFEIESGAILALDGQSGTFSVVGGNEPLPVAVAPREPQPQLRWAAIR
ncbi:MAG: carbonic anhydrase [Candidatus Andeanibacterium colombiense]|uniref:Carbonic anhydrase n=1 Tax=Candidatus Andeanibacterium colombiense TaxID=3121345 RepID=A0AAJ5X8Q9_9SPHN|nr:MAG: carbonic anhydrase [Sphingomonadaceae bacterium]